MRQFLNRVNLQLVQPLFHATANPPEIRHLLNAPDLRFHVLVRPVGAHIFRVLSLIIQREFSKERIRIRHPYRRIETRFLPNRPLNLRGQEV